MELGLNGKVAAITGGSKGIGLATALGLAAEGALVGICARRQEPLEKAAAMIRSAGGADVLTVPVDMTLPGEPERFIAEVVRRFGRLDLLVNNADREAFGPFEDAYEAAW